jgi:hypothetical protein
MAIRITRIDDIDGTDGAEVINLELDDTEYEIDLCPRNRARLFRVIRPFIERARPLDSDLDKSPGVRYRSQSQNPLADSTHTNDLIAMAREVIDDRGGLD